MMRQTAFVLSMLFVTAPVFAQSTPNPKVYKQLFEAQQQLKAAVGQQKGTAPQILIAPQKQVVCGMTIITPDMTIDPKMSIERKKDGVDYKIRVIEPPICNPSR